MITLFHVGNPAFRQQIAEQGLVPQIGTSYECHIPDATEPRIYLCYHNKYDSTYADDRYMVKLPTNSKLHTDPDVNGAVYTTEPILTANLTLIHKGTGESTI